MNALRHPPFQMYGGKWEMAPWIIEHLPPHHTYVEPYGGGASVLFLKEPSPVEVYNDIDWNVVNFFRMCRERPEELAAMLALTPYSRWEYNQYRGFFTTRERPGPSSDLELARQFATVARQSMGGAWGRSWSRVITHSRRGMASGNSRWLHLPETILAVAARLQCVQIEFERALDIIPQYDRPATCFYCDPPYHPDTCQADIYQHSMPAKGHEILLETLKATTGSVVLSGYRNELYDKELANWKRVDREVPCRSNVNSKGGTADRPRRVESLWIKLGTGT